jgi:signal transduction histidine kinase
MNALDATGAGGKIAVQTEVAAEGLVALTVKDDGVGIPPEIRDKIFNPFFTTKPFGQGTGLGLAICHGIVTAHGGEIHVESEVGQGTRIRITLPALEQEAVL